MILISRFLSVSNETNSKKLQTACDQRLQTYLVFFLFCFDWKLEELFKRSTSSLIRPTSVCESSQTQQQSFKEQRVAFFPNVQINRNGNSLFDSLSNYTATCYVCQDNLIRLNTFSCFRYAKKFTLQYIGNYIVSRLTSGPVHHTGKEYDLGMEFNSQPYSILV